MMDTLALAKKLVAAGVPKEQAEAHAEALKEALYEGRDRLVTLRAETRPLRLWLGINTALNLAILGRLPLG
jgi:hypothetical protein